MLYLYIAAQARECTPRYVATGARRLSRETAGSPAGRDGEMRRWTLTLSTQYIHAGSAIFIWRCRQEWKSRRAGLAFTHPGDIGAPAHPAPGLLLRALSHACPRVCLGRNWPAFIVILSPVEERIHCYVYLSCPIEGPHAVKCAPSRRSRQNDVDDMHPAMAASFQPPPPSSTVDVGQLEDGCGRVGHDDRRHKLRGVRRAKEDMASEQ